MVSSHIRRFFRRRMILRIRIRTAYALGHPRAPRRKNTPALSVHRQYIMAIGDCQSSCHNCIYRQTFSAAHLAFSADLWYTEHGTQLNNFITKVIRIQCGILYLSFPYTEKVVCQQSEILYAGRVSAWSTLFSSLQTAFGGRI